MTTILVADDNSNIQKMVALALKDEGIQVVGVSNGDAAVRKLHDVRPDLVLADVFMPVRNGYEVCEFVKNDPQFSQTPVILLVGAFDPLDEREADRVRADGVLKKPFVPPEPLITLVKSVLAKSVGAAPQHVLAEAVPVVVSAAVEPSAASATVASPQAPSPGETQEEPPEDFVVPPQRIEFEGGERPLAFGDLLETSTQPPEPALDTLREPGLAETKIWDRAETAPEQETEPEPIPWRADEPAFPHRDEAVSFPPTTSEAESVPPAGLGEEEPAATVSAEPPEVLILPGPQAAAELHVEPGPPPELASTPEEWLETATAHPPAPLPIEAETPWTYAAPPETQAMPAEPAPSEVAASEPEAAPATEMAVEQAGVVSHVESGVEEETSLHRPAAGGGVEATEDTAAGTEHLPVPPVSALWSTPLAPATSSAPPETLPAAREASPSDAGVHAYAAPPTADSRVVEAVVARIIERLQPQVLDIVTREILRPVVETLVRRELEKT